MKRTLNGIKLFSYLTLIAIVVLQCSFAMRENMLDGDTKFDVVADEVKGKPLKITIDIEDNHNPKRPNCGKRCKTLKDCPKGQYCMENRGPCGYTCTLPDTEAGRCVIDKQCEPGLICEKTRWMPPWTCVPQPGKRRCGQPCDLENPCPEGERCRPFKDECHMNCEPIPKEMRLNGKQCSGKRSECPWDTCNSSGCNKGCASRGCTKAGCMKKDAHTKKENQLCVLKRGNCKKGFKCMNQDDGCNNGIGRCVKMKKMKLKNRN